MLYPVNRKEIKLLFSSSQPHLREASELLVKLMEALKTIYLLKKKT